MYTSKGRQRVQHDEPIIPDFLCYNTVMDRNYTDVVEKSLDGSQLQLLHLLAYQAVGLQVPLYLVGGVVRDILLGYPIKEFDLVVEGDSVEFVEHIVKKIGGRALIHSKFGTATWELNDSTLKRLNFPEFDLADFSITFDLISARSETYSYPGALPTVTRSTIDDDLRRRDFTINAMAIRLDGHHFGDLFDPLDGKNDLEQKLIRTLHKRSFLDDPTRMFRAIRYARRYEFQIESDTRALFNEEAKAVLSQLSGERIRHEFDLIFEEEKPLLPLTILGDGAGFIKAVHPALDNRGTVELSYLQEKPEGLGEFAIPDILTFRQTLGWILYLIHLPVGEIESVAERLAFPAQLKKAVIAASSLHKGLSSFRNWKPSQWTFHLDEVPPLAVYAVWLVTSEPPLREYLEVWQNVKPFTTGNDLKQHGLTPGPGYKQILSLLRSAWLDGEVKTKEEEMLLCNRLIAQ